jgi:hypothetical protein
MIEGSRSTIVKIMIGVATVRHMADKSGTRTSSGSVGLHALLRKVVFRPAAEEIRPIRSTGALAVRNT